MKCKPKEVLMYRFGTEGRCFITLSQHQIWDATEVPKNGLMVLTRENVEIAIPYSDFKIHFKPVRPKETNVWR